ncbi:hypothetical protein [Sphingomonas fuzhouensis]|uniref:hypothetical protein n=1 Tax=Sphingomonas fuzhouensis TaxID=3106033 RepID=UPI002AFF9B04|nr:hypothetical protein [Sphingomonas sp. SGZ-02]
MQPHIRAITAASADALVTGNKVAGLYDHQADRHLRIAAEARGQHLQGFDGDRNAKFGGSLPELRDTGADTSIYMQIDDDGAQGFDRSTSSHFTIKIAENLVQLYDHSEATWFTFTVEIAPQG